MWACVTDSEAEAQRTIDSLSKMLNRPAEELSAKLIIGSPEHCAAIL